MAAKTIGDDQYTAKYHPHRIIQGEDEIATVFAGNCLWGDIEECIEELE